MSGPKREFMEEYNPGEASVDIHEVDAAIFGDLSDSGREQVVARPILIEDIWPDMAQPRRAVPAVYRGEWDGNPLEAPSVLEDWRRAQENKHGGIDVERIIAGLIETNIDAEQKPDLAEYLDLLALAAGIYVDGLINPITVIRDGGRHVIETGERRWLAFHLLRQYVDGERYARIPARVEDRPNPWRQAQENSNRRNLNAIGMARQLAILIMDMYKGEKDADFRPYGEMVVPGGCDRSYYAQVGDGNIWRIRPGLGQRVLDVTGLKSRSQISRYRSLLTIPDEIWKQADVENWAEGKIRDHIKPPKPQKKQDTLPIGNIAGEKGGSLPPRTRGGIDAPRQRPEAESPKWEGVRADDGMEYGEEWTAEDEAEARAIQAEADKQLAADFADEHLGEEPEEPVILEHVEAEAFLVVLYGLARAAGEVDLAERIEMLQKWSPEKIRAFMHWPGKLAFDYTMGVTMERLQDFVQAQWSAVVEFADAVLALGDTMEERYPHP